MGLELEREGESSRQGWHCKVRGGRRWPSQQRQVPRQTLASQFPQPAVARPLLCLTTAPRRDMYSKYLAAPRSVLWSPSSAGQPRVKVCCVWYHLSLPPMMMRRSTTRHCAHALHHVHLRRQLAAARASALPPTPVRPSVKKPQPSLPSPAQRARQWNSRCKQAASPPSGPSSPSGPSTPPSFAPAHPLAPSVSLTRTAQPASQPAARPAQPSPVTETGGIFPLVAVLARFSPSLLSQAPASSTINDPAGRRAHCLPSLWRSPSAWQLFGAPPSAAELCTAQTHPLPRGDAGQLVAFVLPLAADSSRLFSSQSPIHSTVPPPEQ
ncbi:hypothetical protein Purlil1_3758 [Purpureocillium lilacinum]|uniref:Uncharacterized protein n=1 Tax=Purpureocillium lilacinum TaxID=33203 RepID=A0ABR0C6B6_PURLI|nr:hypothetical protein Purlil1_3758 [Purpureocillium lilacinum]